MDGARLKALARVLLEEVLTAGTAATAGPVVPPAQEGLFLDAIELRLKDLLQNHAHESDVQVTARFKEAHPDLFAGDLTARRRAVERKDKQ